ncbi:Multidrug transporter MdtB [Luteitalea pratensis]|uniref:Multidrug transporter MdtB n=1 Tax=Luteitalea pratensis TaxID=1855912 RepID=A0A143PNP7_LUTPR|nr:efflux RND transporter permease subunit [Luteitalea pratensis]AMY10036.1 Multidrug transporter MdtB [Luteitalea pratensis]
MHSLADICIRRPVFASMIVLSLVVVGAAAYLGLGVDRFPSVDLPTVRVQTVLPGASPEEVEVLVSQRLEEVINTVEGISELRSVSGQGISLVLITFDLNRNVDVAAQDVRDRVATALNRLPRDARPPVIAKFDNDSTPVMSIALSGNRSVRELTELADKVAKVQFERRPGVGEVLIVGGQERAISVWLEANRLAAYGIPVSAVRDALVRQNADLPGGNVTTDVQERVLRTMGRVQTPADFANIMITNRGGVPLRISDVGRVEDGTKEQRSLARLNGKPTVIMEVRRQSGSNTVAVIDGIKDVMPRVQAQLPGDVKLDIIRDQSIYIYNALHEINTHLVLGSILACLVVMLFMRSWRSTIIAGVAIPASVISTFGMMRALDFTLNSVTMLALVLMVGIVIDDAIVVLENIFRWVEEKKMDSFAAAKAATEEIALPVMATTLSLAIIFIPVSFMSSISGRFLYQFGITAAVAILVSLLVSFTLTPMMSARLLRGEMAKHQDGHASHSRAGFYRHIDGFYTRALGWSMGHRSTIMGVGLLVALSSIPLYSLVRQEYVPTDVDEAEFEVSINAPEGTSVAAMDDAMRRIEHGVRAIRGVRTVLATVGGSFLGAVNQAQMYIRIAPHEERLFSLGRLFKETLKLQPMKAFEGNYNQRQVMGQVRQVVRKFPDLRGGPRNVQTFNFGGGPSDIDVSIQGPVLEDLARFTEELRKKTPDIGIIDADTTLKLDRPELRVQIDRERSADLDVDTQDVATALRLLVGGDDEVTRYRDVSINDDYDVQLRLSDSDRQDVSTIGRLLVPSRDGRLIRLDNLVNIEQSTSPSRVDRLDRQRDARVRGNVAPGFALADRLAAIRGAASDMKLPAGYTVTIGGRGKELEKTFVEFLWAFSLSVIFMYMILAAQFESVIHPFTILLSLPLAVPFALLSLWATGNTLNLFSALGLLVLFGVVKKNSILQIDHMNNLRAQGMPRYQAIIQANRDRLRPILMTTLALVGGMLPLALGTGPGAEERRTIAVVVIGGQTLSLLLTLLVTPVAYSVFEDLAATEGWHRLRMKLSGLKPTPRTAA